MARAIWGGSPTEDQLYLADFISEALINLRTLTEVEVFSHVKEKPRARQLLALNSLLGGRALQ